MRVTILVTVATLSLARDSVRAQEWSVMAQAVPVVTRADPTSGRSVLTEGNLSQPVIMAHASWKVVRGVATANLEGLTLERGELATGAYGEGYVDRRHPHAYVHELLAGVDGSFDEWRASLFAGRGFAPFGSDDPMVRPFEKYPVNHHLAQVLERVVAVGALRRGPVIGELGVFNGDEPTGPGAPPDLGRFGDSWASRLTVLPLAGIELSASFANVVSPEVRVGRGLDQRKKSLVARFDREMSDERRYGLLEWAHTDERDRGDVTTSLSSVLGEIGYCRLGVIAAARLERTDRPEEEETLDPFRTPRPPTDLSNLGVSRWTTLTASLSAPRATVGILSGRAFVEIARIGAAPGNPPGVFNADLRYGTRRMWMYTAGVRLHAGMMHGRMGRYGAAIPETSGTPAAGRESQMMPGMSMSGDMATHQNARCSL